MGLKLPPFILSYSPFRDFFPNKFLNTMQKVTTRFIHFHNYVEVWPVFSQIFLDYRCLILYYLPTLQKITVFLNNISIFAFNVQQERSLWNKTYLVNSYSKGLQLFSINLNFQGIFTKRNIQY